MNDHDSPLTPKNGTVEIPSHVLEAERRQMEIFKNMTPAQRYQQFMALRATAWKYKRAAIKAEFPDLSEGELEERVRKVFLHATT